jgi:hypothetical protein
MTPEEITSLFREVAPPPGVARFRESRVRVTQRRPRPRLLPIAATGLAVATAIVAVPLGLQFARNDAPPAVYPSASDSPPASPTATASVPPPSPTPTATRSAVPPSGNAAGVPAGTALREHRGDLIVSTAGTVVEKLHVVGSIIVQAPNVRIRQTRVSPPTGAYWVIRQAPGAADLTVEHTELAGGDNIHIGLSQEAAGLTVSRSTFTGVDTGVSVGSRASIGDSVFTRVDAGVGTSGGASQVTIRRNTITTRPTSVEAAIGLYTEKGSLTAIVVEDNRLAGGNYTFHVGEGRGTQHITAQRNRIARTVHPNGGRFGPVAGWDTRAVGNRWVDNVWDDTGAHIRV